MPDGVVGRTPITRHRVPTFTIIIIIIPEMSATEAQLGLAYEFEFEFDLKFDDRVRVRVSSSSFRVQTSGFEVRVPFRGSFSVPFPVHLGTHFRSVSGSQKGREKDHFEQ